MAAVRGLVASTEAMQQLTAERVAWMMANGVAEATERITSKANLWADTPVLFALAVLLGRLMQIQILLA